MVSRDVPQPPWRQVYALLRARLEGGEWSGGRRLPTVRALAAEYQVAPMTVGKAMTALREDGLVITVAGWGSFAREPPPG